MKRFVFTSLFVLLSFPISAACINFSKKKTVTVNTRRGSGLDFIPKISSTCTSSMGIRSPEPMSSLCFANLKVPDRGMGCVKPGRNEEVMLLSGKNGSFDLTDTRFNDIWNGRLVL